MFQTFIKNFRKKKATVLIDSGNQLKQEQKFEQAIKEYQQALKFQPDSIRALYRLGAIHTDRKEWDLAQSYYEKILKLRPNQLYSKIQLANLMREKGQIGEAEIAYEQALAFQQQAGIINRTTTIQNLIDQRQAKIYLEIGVCTGDNFLQIKADKKMAVDPYFKIPGGYTSNEFTNYHEITSDDFFAAQSDILAQNGLDIVFVDGLHNYEQSLKDVLNSLEYLNEGGIIVMHDCNPPSKASAHPVLSEAEQMPGFKNLWMGDVWKTIVYLRSLRSDLRVFVLDCDCGVGIVQKKSPESMLNYSQEAIDNLGYEDLEADRANLLNLKKADYSIE